MTAKLKITIDAWPDGGPIPEEYAFCVPADEGHVTAGRNRNPGIRWADVPPGTRSFALLCHDPDVPSKPDDVNREEATVPADLPRMDFYHWVLVDIPVERTELMAGEDSNGVRPGGKEPGKRDYGVRGVNNFTEWFTGNEQMRGEYGGYDGPCPPWNDEIIHHYYFTVFALDTPSLGLSGAFGGPEVLAAMEGHILAEGQWVGTYTLNPNQRG